MTVRNKLQAKRLAGASVLAIVSATTAMAAQPEKGDRRKFDIEAQPLETALLEYSEEADVVVTVPAQLVKGKRAPAVRGDLAPSEALSRLLQGSDLRYTSSPSGGVTIVEARLQVGGAQEPSRALRYAQLTGSNGPVSDDGTGNEGPYLRETITVTAQRRGAQGIQDVPISITALGEDKLELLGADDFIDFAFNVPGLSFEDFGPTGAEGNRDLTLRGISSSSGPTVGFYLDEASIPFRDPKLLDIARIEVLRGPQPSLYGAGSVGGTIRFITNQPRADKFEGSLGATALSVNEGGEGLHLDGVVNIPIVEDRIAARIVGFYRTEDGYIDNVLSRPATSDTVVDEPIIGDLLNIDRDVNDEETFGVRAQVAFFINDNLTVTPSVFHQDTSIGARPVFDVDLDLDDLQQVRLTPTPEEDVFTLYNLTVDQDLGWGEIVSSTSYFETDFGQIQDLTGFIRANAPFSPAAAMETEKTEETFAQEIRLVTDFESRFNFVIGGFFRDYQRRFRQSWFIPGFNDAAVEAGVPLFVPDEAFFLADDILNLEEFAVFGEIIVNITDKLELAAGGRWFSVEQEETLNESGFFAFPPFDDVVTQSDESSFRPKVQLSYKPTDDALIYAVASEGFRVGGVNRPLPDICDAALTAGGFSDVPAGFESDSVWNYEAGVKTSWAEDRLIANVSGYYMDWSDIQQSIVFPECGFGFLGNGGNARSIGVEFDLTARPIEGLELSAVGSFIDAELTEDAPSISGEEGERLLNVPRWSGALSAYYYFPAFRGFTGLVGGDFRYVGEQFESFDQDDPGSVRESYTLTNLRAGMQDDDWQFAVFVQNLTDERPILSVRGNFSGTRAVTSVRPRTIGVELKRSF